MVTIGISPKVKVPAIALGIVGVVLVAASYVVDGLQDLREPGAALIAASPIAGYLGYRAPPGDVTQPALNLAGGVTEDQRIQEIAR